MRKCGIPRKQRLLTKVAPDRCNIIPKRRQLGKYYRLQYYVCVGLAIAQKLLTRFSGHMQVRITIINKRMVMIYRKPTWLENLGLYDTVVFSLRINQGLLLTNLVLNSLISNRFVLP